MAYRGFSVGLKISCNQAVISHISRHETIVPANMGDSAQNLKDSIILRENGGPPKCPGLSGQPVMLSMSDEPNLHNALSVSNVSNLHDALSLRY